MKRESAPLEAAQDSETQDGERTEESRQAGVSLTAEETIREMRALYQACDCSCSDRAPGWADAIEAELKVPRFSAEEREALEQAEWCLLDPSFDAASKPSREKAAATLRKMLDKP
jgi:hypothetical protein